jgi:hypothetical protein
MRMNPQTRILIANILLGLGLLAIVVFVATHFMTPPRPAWRNDMIWVGLACVIIARPLRRRRGM